MEPRHDARLRLAAQRHPAARVVGTLHLAQHHLAQVARAFVTLMDAAGDPGARPLPPPARRGRWPRGHQARNTAGWPVPVTVDDPFQCWIDTQARWWMIRFDARGSTVDAHTIGTPLRLATDLDRFRTGLEQVLERCAVPAGDPEAPTRRGR
jgi:hypothetical protein